MNAIRFFAFATLVLATALAHPASVLAQATDSLPQLIEKLKHDDANVRAAAAQALKELGPRANMAVPALIERLEDADLEVRNLAYEALEKIGPVAAPELVRVLKSKAATKTKAATGIRVQIARILGKLRPESKVAEAALLEIFDDPDSNFKEGTIALLSWPPPVRAALPKFIAILEDKRSSRQLRSAAIYSLGGYGAEAEKALPLLWQAWQDPSEHNIPRGSAAYALVKLTPKDPALVRSLRKVVTDTGEGFEIRAMAGQCLGELGPLAESAIPDLAGVFKEKFDRTDRDSRNDFLPIMHTLCLEALAKIGPNSKAALQAVLDVAQATTFGEYVRSDAIREMPKFSSDETVSVLIRILTQEQLDRQPAALDISYAAVRAFAEMGHRARPAVPILERIGSTRDRQFLGLKVEALGALERIRADK